MSDDTSRGDKPSENLDDEIEAALGGHSVLEIAGRELLAPTQRKEAEVKTGNFAEGLVTVVGREDLFVEFGPRLQGVVPCAQFSQLPEPGERIKVFVESFDGKESLYVCSVKRTAQAAEWGGLEVGSIIAAEVKAHNAGGLELQAGVLTAFLPVSHIELERVEELEPYIGRRFDVEVMEVDPEKRRLVVSRRGLLNRDRDQRRADVTSALVPGSVLQGEVTRVEPYGAFVDIGGVEGLLHVSEIAWKRVEDPNEHVKVGDRFDVQIQKIEEGGKRISLSKRALTDDPWDLFVRDHPRGSLVPGKVTRIQTYGAFVEIAEGVEGLAHVSQLSPVRVNSPKDIVRLGQELSVRVHEIDTERRRIGLSLLTDRGDLLTDDVADDDTIRDVLNRDRPAEPTLGDLLKRALEGK
ncbi:MAG: S1 RNA-binding domain-containing protein [Planctomycetota bacterium]|nr:S1 RNA-binding domain-containing protein [Planctomycetota bacterium]